MTESQRPEQEKTLEMRVAEIENRLAQLNVTEEEMRAYQKVSALMAGGGMPMGGMAAPMAAPMPALSPIVCVIPRSIGIRSISPIRGITPIINVECNGCGPCACGVMGGGFGGMAGGFGGFGM